MDVKNNEKAVKLKLFLIKENIYVFEFLLLII